MGMSDGKRAEYSREDVEEVLRLAARRMQDDEPKLSHEELIEAAREAGLDVEAVEAAANELHLVRHERRAIEVWSARRRQRLASHTMVWLTLCAGLSAMNWLSGPPWWVAWVWLGWGMLMALHALRVLRAPSAAQLDAVAERARKQLEGQRKRDAKRASREAAREQRSSRKQRRQSAERAFDHAVERAVDTGVTAIFEAVARGLDRAAAPRTTRKQTDFDRFVAAQKSAAARVQVRVEPRVASPHTEAPLDDHEELQASAARRRSSR